MRHTLRRIVAGLTVSLALLLPACSDQPTEVPSGPQVAPPGGASLVDPVESCLASSIESQIKALAPPGALRTSLLSKFKSIPAKVEQRTGTAARDKMFALVDAILDAYYAGQFGGTSTAIQDKVLTLIRSLYCFVRLDSPTLPAGSLEDGVVGVVTPNSPTTTLVVPSEHAAVTIPAGAAPSPTTIVIRILPDAPPPLFTSLDQYPFFYEFSAFPEVTFNLDVLAGICPRDNLDAIDANLRLAHNVGTSFGDVEVLPRPAGAVPGLDCTDLALGSAGNSPGLFAWGGWSRVTRALTPLGRALLPEPLHAATLALATTGVGGTTRKYSPFGIVDILSNPASLDFNPDADAFASLAALPGGSVTTPSVVLTSQQGDPIPSWPVTFSVASGGGTINGGTVPVTVVTGPNGVASLTSWNLGAAGINTVSATPTPVSQLPSEPLSTDAFRPAGAFTPTSLTFSATAAGEIDYLTAGYRYLISNTDRVFPVGVVNFDDPGYQDTGWLTGNAAFGFNDPANNCPLITAAGGVKVTWSAGTDILLRRPFTVPAGTTSAEVKVAIDNDIKVFVNGTEITNTAAGPTLGGFKTHEGCPTLNSFVFTANNVTGDGVNWLAIQARDRGGSSYVDADVVPVSP